MGFSKKRSARYHFRVSEANDAHIRAQARNPQFRTASNYLNWLLDMDRAGRDEGLRALEEKISATVDQVRQDIGAAHAASEAGRAFFHACVKMWLANQPEADGSTKQLAVSQAERRYQKLLTNAAQLMSEPHD